MGDVLEDAVHWTGLRGLSSELNVLLSRSCLPRGAGALPVGAQCSCAGAGRVTTPSCLPRLAARSHHPQFWRVPGTAGRFLICF